jgi:hypothetical protein
MAEANLEVLVGGLTLISLYRYAYCSDLGIAGGMGDKKGLNRSAAALADCRLGQG